MVNQGYFYLLCNFNICIGTLGIIQAIILITFSKNKKLTNKLLGTYLLTISVWILINAFSRTTFIQNNAIYFGAIKNALSYFKIPLLYLYIKSSTTKFIKFKKQDWLHLFLFTTLPSLIFMLAYSKYNYNIDIIFIKIEILANKLQINLAIFNLLLQVVINSVYLFFELKLLTKNNREQIFTYPLQVSIFYGIEPHFTYILYLLHHEKFYINDDLLITVSLSITVFLLFFKPNILYSLHSSLRGISNRDINQSNTSEKSIEKKRSSIKSEGQNNTFILSDSKIAEYTIRIETLIKNEKVFLRKKYSIKDFASDCDMPVHHLSTVIKKKYNTNYSDFINQNRIDFIIANRHEPPYLALSLEGLCYEAGFNSRSTFINAFKRIKKETPSYYFNNILS